MSSLTKSSFRTDINGLRAWAVLAVVLYQFGVPGFTGGFVGVDVFFVISGLLMSGITIGGARWHSRSNQALRTCRSSTRSSDYRFSE